MECKFVLKIQPFEMQGALKWERELEILAYTRQRAQRSFFFLLDLFVFQCLTRTKRERGRVESGKQSLRWTVFYSTKLSLSLVYSRLAGEYAIGGASVLVVRAFDRSISSSLFLRSDGRYTRSFHLTESNNMTIATIWPFHAICSTAAAEAAEAFLSVSFSG